MARARLPVRRQPERHGDAYPSYKSIIATNTTLMLSTDSDMFKFLKGITPETISATGTQR